MRVLLETSNHVAFLFGEIVLLETSNHVAFLFGEILEKKIET